jgi:hypothetical protein
MLYLFIRYHETGIGLFKIQGGPTITITNGTFDAPQNKWKTYQSDPSHGV